MNQQSKRIKQEKEGKEKAEEFIQNLYSKIRPNSDPDRNNP